MLENIKRWVLLPACLAFLALPAHAWTHDRQDVGAWGLGIPNGAHCYRQHRCRPARPGELRFDGGGWRARGYFLPGG